MSTIPTPPVIRTIRVRSSRLQELAVWAAYGVVGCAVVTTIWFLTHNRQLTSRQKGTSDSRPLESTRSEARLQQLGLVVESLTPDVVEKHKLGSCLGVWVKQVTPNSSGTEAGLRVGDVILVLGNHPVTSLVDFDEAVRTLPSGTRKPIEIVREGYRMTLHLKFNRPRTSMGSP